MATRTETLTATPTALSFTATATLDFESKAADGTPKRPTFAIRGYTGAAMSVAGFYSPVIVDLTGLKARGMEIPALLDHDTSQIVGQTDSIKIGADGVDMTGIITGEDVAAERVRANAKNGFKWQASIGAEIVRQEFLKGGEKATVNGREISGPMMIAREARLKEISFVALGADDQTSAAVAASAPPPPGSTKGAHTMFEQWLQAKGFTDPAALSDAQRTFLRAMYDAEEAAKKTTTTTVQATQGLDEIVANRRKEDQRIAEITKLAREAMDERPVMTDEVEKMARVAIEAKSGVTEFELALMRAMRVRTSAGTGGTRGVDLKTGTKIIEAALCRTGRLDNTEKYFKPEVIEAAADRFPDGLGLRDVLVMAARENGYTSPTNSDVRGLLEAAFGGSMMVRANDGFSTLSLPGILSNVANKFLISAFNSVETGWREIAAIRSANDFKAMTTYALTGGMTYQKVGPDGELKHAKVGETTYANQVETYGRMFAITRQDIVNDNLGALTAIPAKLGRGAALALNLAFWTEFLADAGSFYTAGHGNVSTGGGSALSSAGLQAAQLKFSKQTDPDGLPLGIQPRILLVPPELEITADELMTSMIVNTGGASTETKVMNRNVWANKYRTVMSTYLSNSSITGYSTAAWYLVADPNDLPVIEVAFLNGRETPVVESADADFNVLGIQFRGYHDFGVSKMEYRAAVRSAGS